MTDKLEGDKYITLHMVWPIYMKLNNLLAKSESDFTDEVDSTCLNVSNMKQIGRTYIAKNEKDMCPSFEHKAMTFLTPNMKKLSFTDSTCRYKLHSKIEEEIENYPETLSESDSNQNVPNEDEQSESNTNAIIDQSKDFASGFFDGFISYDTIDGTPETELERYIKHPIVSEVDTLSWWHDNSKSYPKLYKLVLKLSCIPATSASSERDFSTAGNIITDKRSMLLPENVNDFIVARNIL